MAHLRGGKVGSSPLKHEKLWHTLRGKAHIVFPILTLCAIAVILTSPFYGEPFRFLCTNAFARFCMFWCLAVFSVLSYANRYVRPSTVAIISTAVAVVIGAAFYFVQLKALGAPDASAFFLSCISGAILGALAGTWLIYVLEVYVGGR